VSLTRYVVIVNVNPQTSSWCSEGWGSVLANDFGREPVSAFRPGRYRACVADSIFSVARELAISTGDSDELAAVPEDWSLEPEARCLLLGLIRSVKPRCYVEIGAYRGQTVLAVAEAMMRNGCGTAYAIEPNRQMAAQIKQAAQARELPLRVLPTTSSKAFDQWGREPVDVVLIDGEHSLPSAVFDIAAWSTVLAPEGWILIHDTVTRLSRRFPEDYMAVPSVFDIFDVVGLVDRPSGHVWEGLSFMRWSEESRARVRYRLERGDRCP